MKRHILVRSDSLLQTTSTACFLLFEIAKQPELQERLLQEISSVVGDKEHPTWEDLQKMTLVRNCVKETMRIHSPGTGTVRDLGRDAVLSGYDVPAGVSIWQDIHFMTIVKIWWFQGLLPHCL